MGQYTEYGQGAGNGKNTEYWKAWKKISDQEQEERDKAKDKYVKEYFTKEGQQIFAMAKTALEKGWDVWQQQLHGPDKIGQMKINDLLTGFEAAVYAFPEFELEDVYHSDYFLELAWSNLADMKELGIQGEKFINEYLQ